MIGISFKGRHSSTLNIGVKSSDRSVRPARKNNAVNLSGKHGTPLDKCEIYENRQIPMIIGYINNDNWYELRENAREVADWLSGTGELIFDDEPDKYYMATIYEYIGIEQLHLLPYGGSEVTFECEPFAYMILDTGEIGEDTWASADYPWVIPVPWAGSTLYTFTVAGSKSFIFDNPGTEQLDYKSPDTAKSIIKINGSWTNISIGMNGKTISSNAPGNGELIIDNIDMTITVNGINKLGDFDGDFDSFLPIKSGGNTISISGVAVAVNVLLDFRPEWV